MHASYMNVWPMEKSGEVMQDGLWMFRNQEDKYLTITYN